MRLISNREDLNTARAFIEKYETDEFCLWIARQCFKQIEYYIADNVRGEKRPRPAVLGIEDHAYDPSFYNAIIERMAWRHHSYEHQHEDWPAHLFGDLL